jgi:hypothetical protein
MTARFTAILALVSLSTACSGTLTDPTVTATAGTGTVTFASFLSLGGTTVHAFTVTQAGTITITLMSVTPAGVVGLGVGTPNVSGHGCTLINSLDTSAAIPDPTTSATTPQLTIPAVPGTYCAEVYDSGQLGDVGRDFSVTIVHP